MRSSKPHDTCIHLVKLFIAKTVVLNCVHLHVVLNYLQQSIVIVEKSLLCSLFETPYSTYISRIWHCFEQGSLYVGLQLKQNGCSYEAMGKDSLKITESFFKASSLHYYALL